MTLSIPAPPLDTGVDPDPARRPERPARVLLLLSSLGGGGAERVAVNLLAHCDPLRADIRLGLLRREGPYLGEVPIDRIVAPPRRPRWAAALVAPADILAMIRWVRPEVVMTFGLDLEAQAFTALRMPWAPAPRWICRQDSNPTAEIGALSPSRTARALVTAGARAIHRRADACVVVSRDLAEKLQAGRRDQKPPIQVIHNPTDLEQIERQAAAPGATNGGRPYVVAAGRLVRQKGFDLLIEAFARSRAVEGLDLVILGEGPLLGALAQQAALLGLADRVRFPGFQPNPWTWFARARLFVLASRWEGFGNVVAEALACGAPTLVTDCDFGPREQVEHGKSGWVAPAEDPQALAAAMDVLLSDPARCAALGVAARRRARDFDIAAVARSYGELFAREAAQARGAGRPAAMGVPAPISEPAVA